MTTLHQVSTTNTENDLLSMASDGDAILLLGDSCYHLPSWQTAVKTSSIQLTLYTRQQDLEQRALAISYEPDNPAATAVHTVSDTEWVELTLNHTRTISWSGS